jgi:hypothetical protein
VKLESQTTVYFAREMMMAKNPKIEAPAIKVVKKSMHGSRGVHP